MKTVTLGTLIVSLLLIGGCVTEGAPRNEPASPEEAARANLALGARYITEGRPDIAIDALERAVELQPRFADAHSTLAVAYDMAGDYDLAEEHHRRATQLASSEPNTQNRFAVFLCRQNRWADARPYFQRAVDNIGRSNPIEITNNAGNCALNAGDLVAAETYFRTTLNVDGGNVVALRGMVDALIRSDNYLNARAFWQRLDGRGALQAQDLLSCYRIETSLGDERSARSCADRLQREFPSSPALDQLRNLQADAN